MRHGFFGVVWFAGGVPVKNGHNPTPRPRKTKVGGVINQGKPAVFAKKIGENKHTLLFSA
ncbi:hypothetical protein [Desulfonatronum thioautotrophicum]|uniref:hypothetical protein n=1 Tax=Desulfonatronum thioautotrophicum TaxID=617001 RepID=UPI0013792591|nr:hypothetical protein [Desulfonatronum thioautotrophicum]